MALGAASTTCRKRSLVSPLDCLRGSIQPPGNTSFRISGKRRLDFLTWGAAQTVFQRVTNECDVVVHLHLLMNPHFVGTDRFGADAQSVCDLGDRLATDKPSEDVEFTIR